MQRQIRFGSLIREISVEQLSVSFNDVVPVVELDATGSERPYRPGQLKVRPLDIYRLTAPYFGVRFMEQARSVLPLAAYLALFQVIILRQPIGDAATVTFGLAAVLIGLMLFMEGLKVGLMPFGEIIGKTLPSKTGLPGVLIVAFLLGVGVTFAEPAIGALKAAGSIVQADRAPALYALLNRWSDLLVLCVGIGVGLATVVGTLRFINGWSLKPLVYVTLVPLAALTLYFGSKPELNAVIGLAWDSGAVTTGPVTVPLVLALGIGIANAAGKGRSSMSGFGIVTLASLFPILAVYLLSLGLVVALGDATVESVVVADTADSTPWYARAPIAEILAGLRAIVPLVLFLMFVMRFLLKQRLPNRTQITYGIALATFGMIVFNLGLTFGLARLGSQSGALVPAAFMQIQAVADSPLYMFAIGLSVAVLFAWLLGFGATMAEPALNALGLTVQNLSNGAFSKSVLMAAVSVGVACGIALGVMKIIFGWPAAWLILPGYALAILLTWLSSEEFVNIAWDSAGVTTGPVTVPLVLAMGLGLGNAVGATEGFAILAMASIGPIVSVLTTGLWVQWSVTHRHRDEEQDITAASSPEETS